jgi:hypothetical protein
MARTLAQLKTICQYHGWSDLTTTGLTEETNFINETLQQLSTLVPWPEYCRIDGTVTLGATETAATITAFADYSGTVAGTTSVTSATHGLSTGDVVVISSTTNYNGEFRVYKIDANTFYIVIAYVADDATGTATLQIDKKELSQTRIWRIGSLVRTDRSIPLDEITHDEWLLQKKYHGDSGPPTQYTLQREIDTTGNSVLTRLLTYPKHSSSTTLYYTYQVYPKLLSSDTDITDWPDTRIGLVTQALRIRLSAQDRDTAAVALYGADFMKLVNKAYAFARPSNKPFIAHRSTVRDWKTPIQNIEKTFTT